MVAKGKTGPNSYRNWNASLSGEEWRSIHEYPLFSDAHIVGEMIDGLGPYQLINVVPLNRHDRPTLVLRIEQYLDVPLSKMVETSEDHYHAGFEEDEIAALLSLCLGVRMKAGGETRVFSRDGDPRGRPAAYGRDNPTGNFSNYYGRPILPRAPKMHSIENATILSTFPKLSTENAIALVRATRMYQEAMWQAEAMPELSWILFTSSIEVVANQWRASKEPPIERMRTSRPKLADLLHDFGGEELVEQVAVQIADYMGATRKFIDFVMKFLPPPPENRPVVFAQHSWAESDLRKTLRTIYQYRSRALHGGHPFPAPMCVPPSNTGSGLEEKPAGLATSMMGAVWVAEDTPLLLHMFEYLVRCAILNWWQSILVDQNAEIDPIP